MISRVKGTPITEEFLCSFGKIYNAFKSFGLCPTDINTVFVKLLGVTDSTVRRYVRLARVAGFITDSYEENRKAMIDRQKGKNDGDESVKEFIGECISYIEPEKHVKKKTTRKRKQS